MSTPPESYSFLPEPQLPEYVHQVLRAFAARDNWENVSKDNSYPRYTLFKACQDPSLLAQAALGGEIEVIDALLSGWSQDPFVVELKQQLAEQSAGPIEAIHVRVAFGDLPLEQQDQVVAYLLSQLSLRASIDSDITYSALEACAMQVRMGRSLDELETGWLFGTPDA